MCMIYAMIDLTVRPMSGVHGVLCMNPVHEGLPDAEDTLSPDRATPIWRHVNQLGI